MNKGEGESNGLCGGNLGSWQQPDFGSIIDVNLLVFAKFRVANKSAIGAKIPKDNSIWFLLNLAMSGTESFVQNADIAVVEPTNCHHIPCELVCGDSFAEGQQSSPARPRGMV